MYSEALTPQGFVLCVVCLFRFFFFFSSRRRHTRLQGDWSSDVCSSDLLLALGYAVVYARNGDFAVAVLLVAIVGVSVYLFLPIRAAHYPPINEGEPTTWKALWEVLTRQQYGKPPVWERQASLGAQIGMWFQYFSWQWGRDWDDSTSKLFGLVLHWHRALAV